MQLHLLLLLRLRRLPQVLSVMTIVLLLLLLLLLPLYPGRLLASSSFLAAVLVVVEGVAVHGATLQGGQALRILLRPAGTHRSVCRTSDFAGQGDMYSCFLLQASRSTWRPTRTTWCSQAGVSHISDEPVAKESLDLPVLTGSTD